MTFEEFVNVLEYAGFEARSYSGRGMYDRECVGIRCDYPSDAMIDILEVAQEDDFDLATFKHSRTDQLGRSQILYWPTVKWENS